MIFIPYRAKNSPERFPYVTLSLIAANIFLFILTADYHGRFLPVREDALGALGATWANLPYAPWQLLTALFLHAEPLHLIGNMLALYVFGPAVEGRLGYVRYTALYFGTGVLSMFCQMATEAVVAPGLPNLGASGAIMGVIGAYLWVFPFASIMVLMPSLLRRVTNPTAPNAILAAGGRRGFARSFWFIAVAEWHAQWVVGYFVVLDLWSAFREGDGVGHIAHISGAVAGAGLVALWRISRDSKRIAEAKKLRAEGWNYEALNREQLADLLLREPENADIVLAYATRVCDNEMPGWEACYAQMLGSFGQVVSERGNAPELARVGMAAFRGGEPLPATPLLRIGARLAQSETAEDLVLASQLFRQLFKQEKTGTDAGAALFRYAQVSERLAVRNRAESMSEPILLYQTFVRRFGRSPDALAARAALVRLGCPMPEEETAGEGDELRPLR